MNAQVTAPNVPTTQQIKERLSADRNWAGRALIVLHANQTASEQAGRHTNERNGRGFTRIDAEILSSFAEQYQQRGTLSFKQWDTAFKMLPKYAEQLRRIAAAKAASAGEPDRETEALIQEANDVPDTSGNHQEVERMTDLSERREAERRLDSMTKEDLHAAPYPDDVWMAETEAEADLRQTLIDERNKRAAKQEMERGPWTETETRSETEADLAGEAQRAREVYGFEDRPELAVHKMRALEALGIKPDEALRRR